MPSGGVRGPRLSAAPPSWFPRRGAGANGSATWCLTCAVQNRRVQSWDNTVHGSSSPISRGPQGGWARGAATVAAILTQRLLEEAGT